jgi:hypothetical protein
MCGIYATLHSQNRGSDSSTSRSKDENRTNVIDRGRGRHSLRPFNMQWTPTIVVITHRRSCFIHRLDTVASATLIWPNQGIHGPVGVEVP